MELATECTHLWFPSIPNPTRLFLVAHGPPTEYSWLKVRTTNNGGDGFGDRFELGADGCGMPCSSSIAVSSIAGVGLGMLSVHDLYGNMQFGMDCIVIITVSMPCTVSQLHYIVARLFLIIILHRVESQY